MIDMKPQICAQHVSTGNVFLHFYGSVYTYQKLDIAEVCKYYNISICFLHYSEKQCFFDS